jgi:pimeloyl-ACP methyl ester carboxylesterase
MNDGVFTDSCRPLSLINFLLVQGGRIERFSLRLKRVILSAVLFSHLFFILSCGHDNDPADHQPLPQSSSLQNQEIYTMIRPTFPDQPGSATFPYSFRLRPSTIVNAPTLIYLPGGPGMLSMDQEPEPWMNAFHMVFTDVRGSGFNNLLPELLPDEAIRTEYAASDIVAIVDYLSDFSRSGIHFNSYVIWGSSYGTVLATVVAHQIEASRRPRPSGIVLEGTFGKYRENTDRAQEEQLASYNRLWRAIRPSLPDDVRDVFNSDDIATVLNTQAIPYGLSVREWLNYISITLAIGTVLTEYNSSSHTASWRHVIAFLGDQPVLERAEYIRRVNASADAVIEAATRSRAYRQIACRELFPFNPRGNAWSAIITNTINPCEHVVFDRPYDSAQYSLETPLFYFQGTLDSSTLLAEARYHYEHQLRAQKYFISFDRGGHSTLHGELGSIIENVIQQIAIAPESFSNFMTQVLTVFRPLALEVGHP